MKRCQHHDVPNLTVSNSLSDRLSPFQTSSFVPRLRSKNEFKLKNHQILINIFYRINENQPIRWNIKASRPWSSRLYSKHFKIHRNKVWIQQICVNGEIQTFPEENFKSSHNLIELYHVLLWDENSGYRMVFRVFWFLSFS